MTCHFNGQGSGALNDYGRSLFAVEIASNALYDKSTTDEELAARSGFLGKKQLPWWIRPGFKFRGLDLQTSPGSTTSVRKFIIMQADANLALLLDQDQKLVFVASGGYLPPKIGQNPETEENKNRIVSRELYVRWNFKENYFLSAGLFDKVYGIRIVDHTAYSRANTGNAQNDQTHGVAVQFVGEKQEVTLHGFVGNLNQESPLRQKGASGMYERDVNDEIRLGASALNSRNDFVEWTRAAFHLKRSFGKGNSLLAEIGAIQNKFIIPAVNETGSYGMSEGVLRIIRGYNFISQVEYHNRTMSTKSPDETRWSFGLLMFPLPKAELRMGFATGRIVSDNGVTPDQWTAQTQLHLSL